MDWLERAGLSQLGPRLSSAGVMSMDALFDAARDADRIRDLVPEVGLRRLTVTLAEAERRKSTRGHHQQQHQHKLVSGADAGVMRGGEAALSESSSEVGGKKREQEGVVKEKEGVKPDDVLGKDFAGDGGKLTPLAVERLVDALRDKAKMQQEMSLRCSKWRERTRWLRDALYEAKEANQVVTKEVNHAKEEVMRLRAQNLLLEGEVVSLRAEAKVARGGGMLGSEAHVRVVELEGELAGVCRHEMTNHNNP